MKSDGGVRAADRSIQDLDDSRNDSWRLLRPIGHMEVEVHDELFQPDEVAAWWRLDPNSQHAHVLGDQGLRDALGTEVPRVGENAHPECTVSESTQQLARTDYPVTTRAPHERIAEVEEEDVDRHSGSPAWATRRRLELDPLQDVREFAGDGRRVGRIGCASPLVIDRERGPTVSLARGFEAGARG